MYKYTERRARKQMKAKFLTLIVPNRIFMCFLPQKHEVKCHKKAK